MKKILLALAIGGLVIINNSCGSSEKKEIIGVWVPVAYSNDGKWNENPEEAADEYFDAIEFQKDGFVITWDYKEEKENRADTGQFAYSNGVLMVDAKPMQVIKGDNSDEIILSYQNQKLFNWTRQSARASRDDIVVDVDYGVKLKRIARKFSDETNDTIIKNCRPGYYLYEERYYDRKFYYIVIIDENDNWKSVCFGEGDTLITLGFSGSINSKDELIYDGSVIKGEDTIKNNSIKGDVFAVWRKGWIKIDEDLELRKP